MQQCSNAFQPKIYASILLMGDGRCGLPDTTDWLLSRTGNHWAELTCRPGPSLAMMARLYSSCSCLPKPIFLAKLPPEELPGRAGATKMSELTSSGILSNILGNHC